MDWRVDPPLSFRSTSAWCPERLRGTARVSLDPAWKAGVSASAYFQSTGPRHSCFVRVAPTHPCCLSQTAFQKHRRGLFIADMGRPSRLNDCVCALDGGPCASIGRHHQRGMPSKSPDVFSVQLIHGNRVTIRPLTSYGCTCEGTDRHSNAHGRFLPQDAKRPR